MSVFSKGFWKNKSVLVTGCLGFASSWIIKDLIKKGASLTGLNDDYNPHSMLRLEGYEDDICVVQGSITDYATVERVFSQYEIQVCFHLAAQTIEGVCRRSPLAAFETNIKGTWNILEAARNCRQTEAVVIASSDKAYGDQKVLPYHEGQALLGRYPYDASKVCDEILAQSYFHTFGLPVGITRCANIYGGGDLHWSRIVPGTIRSIMQGERPVIRSDGTPVRDYLYVEDAADAYITLAEAVASGKGRGGSFNFSAEHHKSVLEMVKLVISASGRKGLKPDVQGKGKPFQEIDRQILSAKKARSVLGWKAGYSLPEGLKRTFAWYRKYAARFM